MRFLEFINNPQPSPERRSRAEQGEQQWRQQAEQRSQKPQQHWVHGQGGKKHGPFKDYQTANTFRNQRTDVGPSGRITAGENEEETNWAEKPFEFTWNDLAQKIHEMDTADRDSVIMVWDGGHHRHVEKIDYVDDPEMGYVPTIICAD